MSAAPGTGAVAVFAPRSSSGLGRLPLTEEIMGSNPIRGTIRCRVRVRRGGKQGIGASHNNSAYLSL